MNRNLVLFAVCLLVVAVFGGSGYFIDQNLMSGLQTEVGLSNNTMKSVYYQNGTVGSLIFDSTSASDTQEITVWYISTENRTRTFKTNLTGLTEFITDKGTTYNAINSTYVLESNVNHTNVTGAEGIKYLTVLNTPIYNNFTHPRAHNLSIRLIAPLVNRSTMWSYNSTVLNGSAGHNTNATTAKWNRYFVIDSYWYNTSQTNYTLLVTYSGTGDQECDLVNVTVNKLLIGTLSGDGSDTFTQEMGNLSNGADYMFTSGNKVNISFNGNTTWLIRNCTNITSTNFTYVINPKVKVYFNGTLKGELDGVNNTTTIYPGLIGLKAQLYNITTVVTTNATEGLPNLSSVVLNTTYLANNTVTFDLDDERANWTLVSQQLGPNKSNSTQLWNVSCENFTNITKLIGTNVDFTTNATFTNHTSNYVSGGVAHLFNISGGGNITTYGNTYFERAFQRVADGNIVEIPGWKLFACRNMTLYTNGTTTYDMNTTKYHTTGSSVALTDVAYVYGAKLASAATGNVTISDKASNVLFRINGGNTTMQQTEGFFMCNVMTGCTVSNLIYGSDAMFRLRARIVNNANTSRIAYTGYSPAGVMSTFGQNIIKFGLGEVLVWYATPYLNNANISVYYEVG